MNAPEKFKERSEGTWAKLVKQGLFLRKKRESGELLKKHEGKKGLEAEKNFVTEGDAISKAGLAGGKER